MNINFKDIQLILGYLFLKLCFFLFYFIFEYLLKLFNFNIKVIMYYVLQDLEKYIVNLNKNYRYELGIEMVRNRDIQKQNDYFREQNFTLER